MEVIERWNQPGDPYSYLREALASKLIFTFQREHKELVNSNDVALRRAYYRTAYQINIEDMEDFFDKDQKSYLDGALHNKHIFCNPELREKIRTQCSSLKDDTYNDYFNRFVMMEKHFKDLHPEWFRVGLLDDIDDIEDYDTRMEKRVRGIESQVHSLKTTLIGETDDTYAIHEFDQRSLFGDLTNELRTLGVHIGQLGFQTKFMANALWLIIGVTIGYLLA